MPHFILLCLKVSGVVLGWSDLDRNPFDDPQAASFQSDNLFRGVREKPDIPYPQVRQDLGTHAIFAEIGFESESLVGLNGIEPLILETVRTDLVLESYPSPFLPHVEEDPLLRFDPTQRIRQMLPAATPQGAEHIPRQALGVDPYPRQGGSGKGSPSPERYGSRRRSR